jgi:enoyl-CoA hydratase/carnithine racemase
MNYTSPASEIECDCREHILRIAINRPEKMNALTAAMYDALAGAIECADGDPDIRVILIQGAGGCFTSGNDLHDFVSTPPVGEDSPVFRFLQAISGAQKPIIAAVLGPADGVGTTMLLHCDLVYAGECARHELPFVNLGLCPEAAVSLLLPQLAGHQRAAELLLLGEPFSAERAREIGLVNAVFADNEVLQQAWAMARKLAQKPPASVRLTKALLKGAGRRAVAETIAVEARHFLQRLSSLEAQEAFAAFFERRRPDFTRLGCDAPSAGAAGQ